MHHDDEAQKVLFILKPVIKALVILCSSVSDDAGKLTTSSAFCMVVNIVTLRRRTKCRHFDKYLFCAAG